MRIKIGVLFFIFGLATFLSTTVASERNHSHGSLSVDMGEECVIKIDDIFKGHLASGMPLNASYWTDKPPIKTQAGNFGINFVCSQTTLNSKEDIAHQYGGTYDSSKRKWVAYFGDVSKQDAAGLGPVTHVEALNSVNGHGFYLIQDDTDGDLDRRTRALYFCIFHSTKALCGNGHVMRLSDPKGNLLPYALDILMSIEFIDAVPFAPANSSTAPSPNH